VIQFLQAHPAIVGVIVATLVLGRLIHDAQWLHPTLRGAPLPVSRRHFWHTEAPTAMQTPTVTEPVAPSPPTTEPTRPDLSGIWRGEYVDASGNQLFRVVSLSISHVYDDGGIEGTLQYEASSGDGECKLHPRGSMYSAGEQRLQLSPESCSPHYPKELGVPLDFNGVNPQANTLNDGRIEAPTGEVIRVKLRRLPGV
jgi:hypothetical protein